MVKNPIPQPKVKGYNNLEWNLWYLQTHPEVYTRCRDAADEYRRGKPDVMISAHFIFYAVRFIQGTRRKYDDDDFAITDAFGPLWIRLYALERPLVNFKKVRSWVDKLKPAEWDQIFELFNPLRDHLGDFNEQGELSTAHIQDELLDELFLGFENLGDDQAA